MKRVRVGPRRRKTWQRRAIMQAFEAARCHVTAEQLHRHLRKRSRPIGLATVYRAVEAFVREGLVEPVHVGDGKVRYGLTSRHHDHLVCLNCGDWEPLDACLVRRTPRRLASGFRVAGHQLELYGYCARCQNAPELAAFA
ncbi:MAG: Fur family transcriptional regulator [Armatimonadota bacterium]